MLISWARLTSFCHLGFISDPLIVSKFHNETHDPKGQENKIYTIVKGRETFYRRHTAPITSCSKVKYVLKSVSFGSRLLLEYADVVWDNCTQQNKNELELIQLEAAKKSKGETKLVSAASLYIETGRETLNARRNKHKLVLFYKMFNALTPPYLLSLVPPLVQNASRYNLRNSNDTQTIAFCTTLFYNSFLPSSIRDWNRLNPDIRNAQWYARCFQTLTKSKLVCCTKTLLLWNKEIPNIPHNNSYRL